VTEFEVAVVRRDGGSIIFMRGEIDRTAEEQIHDALVTAQHECTDIVVDLSDVTFMDMTGINALVRARRQAPDRLHLVGASDRIRRVFWHYRPLWIPPRRAQPPAEASIF
jgi:anti-anti-sigma factor